MRQEIVKCLIESPQIFNLYRKHILESPLIPSLKALYFTMSNILPLGHKCLQHPTAARPVINPDCDCTVTVWTPAVLDNFQTSNQRFAQWGISKDGCSLVAKEIQRENPIYWPNSLWLMRMIMSVSSSSWGGQ